MNGAESLLRTAAAAGIRVCFANPGTTELPLVAALDGDTGIRPILCLFEGVCSGAADGYARMSGDPAMTLLHLGPGFANGIANFHNARRARSAIFNVIGDHASWHLASDPPLATGHAMLAGSYGGWSYGFRYLLPIQALLLLPAAAALSGARRALLLALLPVSVLFAALGAYHPWPPAFEQESHRQPVASLVRNPVGGNAAAWAAANLPESALARSLGERFVSRDPAERRRYFALFFGSKGDLATLRRFAP